MWDASKPYNQGSCNNEPRIDRYTETGDPVYEVKYWRYGGSEYVKQADYTKFE